MWSIGCGFLCQYHMAILCLMFLRWEGRNCQPQTEALPGFTIEAPAEVTVQRGLCVRIPCSFTVGPGYTLTRDAIGIWYKGYNGDLNEKIVAASTDSSQFPDTTNGRFIFTGKVSAGDCSFSISDAQPGDTDRYQFRLEGPLQFNYLHIQPSVSVVDLKIPDISPTETLMADEEVTLTCTVLANCPGPSPIFTWEGSVNTERTQAHQLAHQDGRLSYRSNITFTPSPSHHNTSLTCIVTNKHGSANASITLKVEYLNKPDILPKKKLIAGEQVTLNCSSFGNCIETSSTITWDGNMNIENVKHDQLLHSNSHVTYVSLMTFTPSQTDHNTSLTCTVTCKGVSTKQSTLLDVEYLNKPDIYPKKKLIAGEQVTLTCSCFGNCRETSSNIKWKGNINITNKVDDWLLHPNDNATYVSHVTFTPSQTDHNTLLTCTVTCKGVSTKQSIILDVEYEIL
eukprot:XP_017951251.1 PREDICTED: myeloid cell surface antigen CD33-like [Xenopus tropicalis]